MSTGCTISLQDSGQELLQVMVKAIEARDPYTSGHSLRVSQLSRLIALEMGLQIKDIEQVAHRGAACTTSARSTRSSRRCSGRKTA